MIFKPEFKKRRVSIAGILHRRNDTVSTHGSNNIGSLKFSTGNFLIYFCSAFSISKFTIVKMAL